MATISKEDALAELKARGVDPANPPANLDSSGIDREAAMEELRRRGVSIPSDNQPALPSYATPEQQSQYPIASMIAKGLGVVSEGLNAPFQAVGEPIRRAVTTAQGQDPGAYRIPTILQRLPMVQKLLPSLETKEQAPDMFSAAVNPAMAGYRGMGAVAQNALQGPAKALQAGTNAVNQPPGAPEAIMSMAAAVGSGEAGNIPFTAAIKPFASLGKILDSGEMLGIPGTGALAKSVSGFDWAPLGLENLTAKANPEVLEAAKKFNVPATAGMMTESPTLNAIESFGKKLPFSSNIFQKRFGEIYESLKAIREPIVEATKPAADLGLDVQQGLSGASNAEMGKARALYQNVQNAIPQGSTIQLGSLSDKSSELLKAQLKLPPGARTPGISNFLYDLLPIEEKAQLAKTPEVVQKLALTPEQISQATQILGKPGIPASTKAPGMDYATLQALRSELGNRITQANSALKGASPNASFQASPEARIYGQLKDAIDKDLNAFSDKTGGAFQSAFSEANKTYQNFKQTYKDDKFVQSILNEQNPEHVVDKVVKAARDNPRALGTLKLKLPTQTLNDLQTYFIKDMSEKDPNIFSPTHFAQQYDSIGEKRLTEILGPEKMAELRPLYVLSRAGANAAQSGHMASGPSGAGMNSGMFLRAPLATAITGMATGSLTKGLLGGAAEAAAEIEGLPLAAKAYLSNPVQKILTRQASLIPSFPNAEKVGAVAGKASIPIQEMIERLKQKYDQWRKM